jgi:hypothetical protein
MKCKTNLTYVLVISIVFKDRIECFDDCYPCMQNECNLFHVHNWIQFFVSMYNDTIYKNDFIIRLQEEVNKILN